MTELVPGEDEMKGAVQIVVGALMMCLASPVRAAAPGLWFEVTRTPDAGACPDARSLSETVESLFDARVVRLATSAKDAGLYVAISIAKDEEGYRAALRVENEGGSERLIVDRDAGCRGLPEALAVAIVLLVEPNADSLRRAQSPPSAAREAESTAPPATHLSLDGSGLFGTGLLGDLGSPTLGAGLGVSVSHGGPGFRARGVRLVRPAQPFGVGSLELDAWALLFGPCWRFALPRSLALSACAELGLGQQHGKARGFEVNREDSAAYRLLATSVTLVVPLGGLVQATGSSGGALRLHRQTYRIDGAAAESQPSFAPFFGVGLALVWKIGDGR